MGDVELSTVFVDQLLEQEFQQEQTEAKVLVSFSLLAIIIACMGLFGSASFTVERRTKEIGLRKVMGARVKNIVTLLLWQIFKTRVIRKHYRLARGHICHADLAGKIPVSF